MTTIFLLIVFIVIAYVLMATHNKQSEGLYLLPTHDRKWKRITELHYDEHTRRLTVVTFDHNVREFYHTDNEPGLYDCIWRNWNSKRTIKDIHLTSSLDECLSIVMVNGKRKGEGRVVNFA